MAFVASSVGSPAPPLDLPSSTGEKHSLSQFLGKPVVVSFLGPVHCMFCRAHVIKMIQARPELDAMGAEVLLVAYQDQSRVMSQLLRDMQLPFKLLLDQGTSAYARWGMGEASWTYALRPQLYLRFLKLWLGGARTLGTSPEPNRLGGDFVVDREGRLVFAHRQKGFEDRPAISTLLSALKQA